METSLTEFLLAPEYRQECIVEHPSPLNSFTTRSDVGIACPSKIASGIWLRTLDCWTHGIEEHIAQHIQVIPRRSVKLPMK